MSNGIRNTNKIYLFFHPENAGLFRGTRPFAFLQLLVKLCSIPFETYCCAILCLNFLLHIDIHRLYIVFIVCV
jgi:hypothetical protein